MAEFHRATGDVTPCHLREFQQTARAIVSPAVRLPTVLRPPTSCRTTDPLLWRGWGA